MNHRFYRNWRAFTLVELLVVIAIIGVLIGLLLPAVQAARASARNLQCKNNLTQMGIGLQSYHTANKAFPQGGVNMPGTYVNGVQIPQSDWRGFAWSAYILPMMEQQSVYDLINFDKVYYDAENEPAGKTLLSTFICPEAQAEPMRACSVNAGTEKKEFKVGNKSIFKDVAVTKNVTYGGSDYGGMYGERIDYPGRTLPLPNEPPRGTLLYDRPIKISDIRDGTSCTIMVSEDSGWVDGQWINGLNVFDQSGAINDPKITENEMRSDHPGGVNAAFADGHVEFLSDRTDLPVVSALCTRAGGEIVENDE